MKQAFAILGTILLVLSACSPSNAGWDRTATNVQGICDMTGEEVETYKQPLRGGQVLTFGIVSEAGYTRAKVLQHQNAQKGNDLDGENIESNTGWIFSYKEQGPLGKVSHRRLVGFCDQNGVAKIRVIENPTR